MLFRSIVVDRMMYDVKKKYVTGKVTQFIGVNPEGTSQTIGEKIYRSKQGMAGKTCNTVKWSTEVQSQFTQIVG